MREHQESIRQMVASEGYKELKKHISGMMVGYNPIASIEDIAKMALIDKGMKDVFAIADSIAEADFLNLENLGDPYEDITNEQE